MITEIFGAVKKLLLPLVVGLITYPLIQVLQYKGIVIKESVLNDKGSLFYYLASTNDTPYEAVIITFSINDTLHCVNDNHRMIFTPVPEDIGWSNSATRKYGVYSNAYRSVYVDKITRGEYVLKIPLVFKNSLNESFINNKTGNIVFTQKKTGSNKEMPFTDVKIYKWYFWIYFHPWWTSIILFSIFLALQFIINKFKNKENEKNILDTNTADELQRKQPGM